MQKSIQFCCLNTVWNEIVNASDKSDDYVVRRLKRGNPKQIDAITPELSKDKLALIVVC